MHIRDYKYTAEDVDCRYCTEFRHGRCRAIKCPWLNERIEAGVISYHDAVNESFSSRSPLLRRIRLVLTFYDKSFWKDDDHFRRFQQADAMGDIIEGGLGIMESDYTDMTVEELDLSVRTYNMLKRANLNTVGEILKLTKKELGEARFMTPRCVDEVIAKLSTMGLSLAGDDNSEDSDLDLW